MLPVLLFSLYLCSKNDSSLLAIAYFFSTLYLAHHKIFGGFQVIVTFFQGPDPGSQHINAPASVVESAGNAWAAF